MSQTVWLSFKEQRTEHVRNPVNAPMTGIGNVIIGRIGTTLVVLLVASRSGRVGVDE